MTKTLNNNRYEISNNDFALCEENVLLNGLYIINDKENLKSQREIMEDYYNTVYEVLLKKLEKFKKSAEPASEKECESVIRAVKNLFEAKKIIY